MRRTHQDGLLVPGVHRNIRALSPGEGPWPGVLVVDGDEHAVWCEMQEGAPELDWRMVGAEHVAAPVDVARTPTGHAALLPWCVETVSAFLARRTLAGAPLTPGEWVTLVISLLRGLRELTERADVDEHGVWWLTEDGRPLCVPGGSMPARDSVAELIDPATLPDGDRALTRLVDGIRTSLAEGPPTRAREAGWERELLDLAAPKPLVRDGDDRTPVARGMDAAGRPPHTERRRVRQYRHPQRTVRDRAAALGAAVMAAATAAAGRLRVRRTVPSAPRPRRRLVVLAGAIVAAVLGAGMLWPSGEESTSAATTVIDGVTSVTPGPVSEPAASAPQTPTPTPAPAEGAGDAGRAAVGLLRALETCADAEDEACPETIADGASVDPGAVLRGADPDGDGLVEDYGDLAVVRITDGTREQMLVVVRQNEKWLVRDVYDVADQPDQG